MSPKPEKTEALEADRIRLRRHRLEDLESCVAMWADPNVTRFIGGKPSTSQQTWFRMLQYGGHWDVLGYGYWVIEEKTTNAFVGEIGFADFKRTISLSMSGVPEAGWALASQFHGKGLATEALQTALAWADVHPAFDRTVCMVAPDNAASIRVAEKSGYQLFERSVFNEQPVSYFQRFRNGR